MCGGTIFQVTSNKMSSVLIDRNGSNFETKKGLNLNPHGQNNFNFTVQAAKETKLFTIL